MTKTVTALLANEAGMGRGHIVKLRDIAANLGPHVRCVAALARAQFAAELATVCPEIISAPALRFPKAALQNPALEGNASWCDFLAGMGLAREAVVRRGLQWWRAQIIAQDASILVADYAPLAMRAANGLKDEGWAIEVISVGTGYGNPPAHLERFPQLLPDCSRIVHPEADVLALMNRVGAEQGLDPLQRLPELYRADLTLAATFAFLDPYATSRPAEDQCPPFATFTPDVAGHGDEVFVYFSTRELQDPGVVAAVCALPLPRRGFFPTATPDMLARLSNAGVQIETAPVGVAAITARSRMVLHAAQNGMISMSSLAGLPQLGLPQHMEQLFNGRSARDQGVLGLAERGQRSGAALTDAVMHIYHDQAMHKRTRAFAHDLRQQTVPDVFATVATRLAPVVERALASA